MSVSALLVCALSCEGSSESSSDARQDPDTVPGGEAGPDAHNSLRQAAPTTPESGASERGLPVPKPADAWALEGLESLRPGRSFTWPLESVHLTSHFGWRTDPVSGAGLRLHRGIDLRGAPGDLVLSIAAGEVRFSGWDPVLGEAVVVDHGGGVTSLYAHLSTRLVHEDLVVAQGTSLGTVGNTGRSAAPHLHLTMKVDGHAVDPLAWLD